MLQLLNKITWVLSFCLSFLIIVGLLVMTREIDSYDASGFILFGVPIIAFVIKGFMFPKNYLFSRLDFFRQQILRSGEIENKEIVDDFIEEPVDSYESKVADSETQDHSNIYIGAETTEYVPEMPKENISDTPTEPGMIEEFFATNLMAKIGGIIIFIAVLIFLIGIYAIIGPVAKIVIGFCIGFGIFGAGVALDKRGYTQESRIVLGVGILVNYLVILSGRYVLGDDSRVVLGGALDANGEVIGQQYKNLLTVGMTFLFLILNTIFAVVTSLVYKSRSLLIFGFAFAYINPLLLGESSSEPYTLLGYTMIVTLGAMYMAYMRKDEILFPLSFVLAAIMFLIAPWSDASGWIAKLLCINLLGVIGLYVSTEFKKTYQYIFEILIAGVFFLVGIMGLLGVAKLSSVQLTLMGVSSLGLMGLCYSQMKKGGYLYSIGTLAAALTLSPVMFGSGLQDGNTFIALFIIIIFGIMNIGVVTIKSKDFLAQNLSNIITGLLSGALFLTYMIYLFGNVYFPGVIQGGVYFVLAIIYCLLSFLIVQKIGIEEMQKEEKNQNIFYTIAAIGVSFFTLAIAFLFAEQKEIVSIVWLLEANVLFYLFSKTKSTKIAAAGLVLFIIGILKFVDFLDLNILWGSSFEGQYGMLIPLAITVVSLLINLVFIYPTSDEDNGLEDLFYVIHNIAHIIGMGTIIVTSYQVFHFSSDWISLLYFSTILSVLGYIYQQFRSLMLQGAHLLVYVMLLLIHIGMFADDLGTDRIDLFISTIVAFIYALPFVYEYMTSKKIQNNKLFAAYCLYLFVLSTLYVLHIFNVTFAVTFFWGILTFAFLRFGINNDITSLRTLGFYLLSLTVGKIFLYDIWQPGVDDGVGFLVFFAIGILMIVLSTMYTKKYGNNMAKEFHLSNIFPENNAQSHDAYRSSSKAQEIKPKSKIQTDIESIDIENISSIKLHFSGDTTPTSIRSENLIKIAKLISNTYKATDFKPGVLENAYTMIETDFKSDLSPAQYKKIRDLTKRFVETGGSIEFIKK